MVVQKQIFIEKGDIMCYTSSIKYQLWGLDMILTDAQKRQVLLNMVYENDDKFLGLTYKMVRPARPKQDICTVPMGYSFLRNNVRSRAQFSTLNGVGKNWLNFMDDVELLHYIDFQNRFYSELREAQCTSISDFFATLEKVPFNKYYQKSADCPKLTKKYETPQGSARLSKETASSPEIRQQVVLETMLKAHNRKAAKGKEIKAISPAIAQEFAIKVKVPTVTQQMMAGFETKTETKKPKLQFAGTVYEVPIYWNGSFYVFADGSALNKEYRDYIAAGELRHEQDIVSTIEDEEEYRYIEERPQYKFEGILYNDPIYSRKDSHGFIEYCHGDGSPLSKQEEELIEAGELRSSDDEMAD